VLRVSIVKSVIAMHPQAATAEKSDNAVAVHLLAGIVIS
jgi:hypothetical protein